MSGEQAAIPKLTLDELDRELSGQEMRNVNGGAGKTRHEIRDPKSGPDRGGSGGSTDRRKTNDNDNEKKSGSGGSSGGSDDKKKKR
ncbi:hypothetical protein [Cohnella caldifontis]|uniref:hypothetical protein n=1 Tax=Cohnella caldifontis TaxID=3027471 RepID=UPI0023EAFAAD|nr:hypothetical protein [Cohnella sp. YIM B05605]